MNDLLRYVVESGVCLALFFLIFRVFLRNETYFLLNRFFLVSALLLSLIGSRSRGSRGTQPPASPSIFRKNGHFSWRALRFSILRQPAQHPPLIMETQ